MKSLVALLWVLGLVAMNPVPCVKYVCDDKLGANVCGRVSNTNENITVFLQLCKEKKVCTLLLESGKDDLCAENYTAPLRYPGEFCNDNVECFSGVCAEKKCNGTQENGICSSDTDCDVNLYCDKKTGQCQTGATENELCDSKKCRSPFVCNGTHCVKIGQLEDRAAARVPALCKSLYTYNGVCMKGPQLEGANKENPQPISCPSTGCNYTVNGIFFIQNCECGRQAGGEKYCSPGKGDINLNPYITYAREAKNCHITKGPLCLSKSFSDMGEGYYNAFVTYTHMTKWVAVHNNSECVKKTLNSEYYDAIDALNQDSDEDKFGLYLFLGIAIGAVVVIGALLLVIYLKRRKSDDDEPTAGLTGKETT